MAPPKTPAKPAVFSKSTRSSLLWEQAWQHQLDALYTRTSVTQLETIEGAANFPVTARRSTSLTFNHRALCKIQRDILCLAAEKSIVDRFEVKWRAAGPMARERHYFEAMKRVVDMPNLEERRWYAPEISLNQFQSGNGQGYLDLLRSLIPEQIPSNQYVRVEHPAVDALLGIRCPFETVEEVTADPRALLQRELDIFRCLFMSLVVWQTLLSFYDRSERTIPVRTEGKSLTPGELAYLENCGLNRRAIHFLKREHRKVQKLGQLLCMSCKKPETLSPEGKLQSCGKCRDIDRHIMYCNRDCQVNDWKNGNPPHKTICGKLASDMPIHLPPAPLATTTSRSTIPPPVCSYRRSIALVHQISLLDRNPTVGYFLILPAPLRDIGISITHPMLKEPFLFQRNYAFQTGDSGAVGFMYKLLEADARSMTEFGIKGLEMQLEAEFGKTTKELRDCIDLARKQGSLSDLQRRAQTVSSVQPSISTCLSSL